MNPYTPIAALVLLTAPLLIGQVPVAPPQSAPEAPSAAAARTITATDLRTHLEVLAADAMEGRLTGTAAHVRAVEHIERHFLRAGLEPLGDLRDDGTRSFRQAYPVKLDEVLESSGLSDGEGQKLNSFGAWFAPPRRSEEGATVRRDLRGPLCFVGSGSKDAVAAAGDLSGVIPVVVLRSAGEGGSKNVLGAMGQGSRILGQMRAISRRLERAGAQGAVFLVEESTVSLAVASNLFGSFPGKPQVTLGVKGGGGDRGMMARFMSPRKIPALVLLGDDTTGVLQELEIEKGRAFAARSEDVGRRSAESSELVLETRQRAAEAFNVVGVLRGRDDAARSECVLYSAHMDHVGMGPDGEAFNGADDNGSGTSALLEIAEAYASLDHDQRPRRSVILLSVSGEELGLWGSAFYAANPTWPLDDVIANVNIDMIGRSTSRTPRDSISVTPTYEHRAYNTVVREAHEIGRDLGIKLIDGDRFYQRSDHYNFAVKGIPVVFFCDDEHPDYHMPTDDVEKLEIDKIETIARLAFLLGFRTAEAAERPRKLGRQKAWVDEPATEKPPRVLR